MQSVKVIIYDDNADRRDSLVALLSLTDDLCCLGAFPDCSLVEDQMLDLRPNVVLMDIDMPNVNGIEGLKIIREKAPAVKVLMQTVFEDNERIFDSIRFGATGYILKSEPPVRILEAIRNVNEGGAIMTASVAIKVLHYFQEKKSVPELSENYGLSEREKEVLRLLSDGNSYKMIAAKLGVTYFTINAHLKKIYEKLQVHSASEAVALAIRQKLV